MKLKEFSMRESINFVSVKYRFQYFYFYHKIMLRRIDLQKKFRLLTIFNELCVAGKFKMYTMYTTCINIRVYLTTGEIVFLVKIKIEVTY